MWNLEILYSKEMQKHINNPKNFKNNTLEI